MLVSQANPLRQFLFDSFVWDLRQARKDRQQATADREALAAWEQAGRPVPPPDPVKRTTIAEFARAFQIHTLVETGTFMGGTLHALKDDFATLYSIELSPAFAHRARRRFRASPHIHILEGDSATVLPTLLRQISSPALFWLDGHYSGGTTAKSNLETPIMQELQTLLQHTIKNHVILIDDARLFNGTHDYPTIDQLRALFAEHRPQYQFSVVNDSIRAHPAKDVKTTF